MKQKGSTVLVIDDDHDIAELMACILGGAGFRTVLAASGTAGLQLARERLPDLILCDAHLPGLDGLAVVAQLRAAPATADIPIVFVTGDDLSRFDGATVDAFLQKPFHIPEFLAVVNRIVARTECAV